MGKNFDLKTLSRPYDQALFLYDFNDNDLHIPGTVANHMINS